MLGVPRRFLMIILQHSAYSLCRLHSNSVCSARAYWLCLVLLNCWIITFSFRNRFIVLNSSLQISVICVKLVLFCFLQLLLKNSLSPGSFLKQVDLLKKFEHNWKRKTENRLRIFFSVVGFCWKECCVLCRCWEMRKKNTKRRWKNSSKTSKTWQVNEMSLKGLSDCKFHKEKCDICRQKRRQFKERSVAVIKFMFCNPNVYFPSGTSKSWWKKNTKIWQRCRDWMIQTLHWRLKTPQWRKVCDHLAECPLLNTLELTPGKVHNTFILKSISLKTWDTSRNSFQHLLCEIKP